VLTDCTEAMIKIKMAFRNDASASKGGGTVGGGGGTSGTGGGRSNIDMVMLDPSSKSKSGSATLAQAHSNLNLGNVHHYSDLGEYQDFLLDPNALVVDDDGDATGFAIPVDLNQMTDQELAERWVLAEQSSLRPSMGGGGFQEDSQEARNRMNMLPSGSSSVEDGSNTHASSSLGDAAVAAANQTLETSNEWSQLMATQNTTTHSQQQQEEQWQAFDPDAEDLGLPAEEDEEQHASDEDDAPMMGNDDEEDENVNDSKVSDIEVARAADTSADGNDDVRFL